MFVIILPAFHVFFYEKKTTKKRTPNADTLCIRLVRRDECEARGPPAPDDAFGPPPPPRSQLPLPLAPDPLTPRVFDRE
ncbi:hypothetical protein B9Z55_011290 [Caenorhabditis nigoni]|uniref:Uncharacterized protein n=1 Tax=Caenorhabditis nigoni TaxID=1611254 RepID=A0A2G5UJE4_9PELO|nr:hypothetical protein B9Z55_011290 [Caenorhabditis nigoni]